MTKPAEVTSPERELAARVDALKKEVQVAMRDLNRARGALESMTRAGDFASDAAKVAEALRDLRRSSLEALGLEDERVALVGELDAHFEREKTRARMMLLGELDRALRADGGRLEHLGDQPLTLGVGPLTLTIDLLARRATLSYAREALAEVDADAQTILSALSEARAAIQDRALESEVFFEQLERAYRVQLAMMGLPDGERVDLVDLLVPLSLVDADLAARRKKGLDALTPWPRYLLAYQLQRLRRDGLLERQGRRLDLGTATGGSTKNKQDVLFVPGPGTDGQYYLSLRFQSVPGTPGS
ncbi:hypothetical protein FRC98_05450 [Lujinxingia vulgaris]|uniref:Uncharacterized protein n=1 Tax=Lujinxingia vulgaris TaxID=2600176 RepID=A0A5C6XJH6_9DELT|nr:hypothetical protein [Lujinxingia vulgaris]TXD38340.1 hypothetical protein FRC98_05450 [Lujinxingia vulgaris]